MAAPNRHSDFSAMRRQREWRAPHEVHPVLPGGGQVPRVADADHLLKVRPPPRGAVLSPPPGLTPGQRAARDEEVRERLRAMFAPRGRRG